MRLSFILLSLAVTAMLGSCVSKKKFDEAIGERDRLQSNLEETQRQVKSLEEDKIQMTSEFEEAKSKMSSEISSLESNLASAKTEVDNAKTMLEEKTTELDALNGTIDAAFDAYETSGLVLEEMNDNIYLKTTEPVLFSSGSIRLGSDDRSVIDSLASLLKANPDLEVIVEGHTDSDKVKGGTAYRDNWDLSYRRADAVVRRLVKAGVAPGQLASTARGEYVPMSDEASKADNRRVVFRISPRMGSIYNAAKN